MSFQTDFIQPDFIQEFADGPYTAFQPDAFQPNFIQEFAAQPILGWECVLPHLINLSPRRGAYAGIRSKAGFAAFPQPFPEGWQIQPFQPPTQPTLQQKGLAALSHPEEGIEGLFTRFFPSGWEIQPYQPPFFPKTNQKPAALSQWEDGIEAPFIPPVVTVTINWSFDIQQPPLNINYRSGAWSQKTEGIDAPYINFFPYGWEIQPIQPPHQFIEKKGSILRGDDGNQAIFINFLPYG